MQGIQVGLLDWFKRRRAFNMAAAVRDNPDAVLEVVRQDPVLLGTAMNNLMMEAASDQSFRRSLQYPILNQLGYGGRRTTGTTLPKVTPFNLRRFSEYPPARRAINAICNPILDMPWTIEPIPLGGGKASPDPTPEQLVKIAIAERVLSQPNDDESFRVVLEQVLEDIVIGGYGAMEVVQSMEELRPLYLYPVDGQSLRVNIHWKGEKDVPRWTQSLGYVGMSVGTHDLVELLDEDLIYIKLNPRTNTPFGLGYLETAFQTVNAFIGAFEYAERRASNMTPAYGIHIGENMTPDQVRRWQQYWEQEIEGYGKIPILGGGRQPSVMHFGVSGEDQLFLKWQEFLIRVIAMSFGLSPMKLGLETDVNRSTALVQQSEDWDTVAPVANTVQDYITRKLVWKALGCYDLRFKWLVRDLDEKAQAEVLLNQWEMNSVTINEIREYYERPPLPYGDILKMQAEILVQEAGVPESNEPDPMGAPPGGNMGDVDNNVVEPVDGDGLPEIADESTDRGQLLQRAYAIMGENDYMTRAKNILGMDMESTDMDYDDAGRQRYRKLDPRKYDRR
jgi:hypothetical protein